MASTVQQQIQEPNILNLENKLRQQSKIAHEVGAGSQCLRCGPKCKGFDLHYWRKVCRNCRCGKENHSVPEEKYDAARVGRLFDDFGSVGDKGRNEAPNSNLKQQLVPEARNTQQVALQSQESEKRNRALDRQLPEHDLDPSKCQSLSDPEKQKMQEYVNNVRQFAVGRGTIQKCPAPPPQLDKILEQKLNIIHTNNNMQALSKSPKVSPKPPPKLFGVPKPYAPSSSDTSKIHAPEGPVSSFTEQIKKEAAKPSAASLAPDTVDELPPPPPEFLEPYPAEQQQQQRSRDPVREFFDFLDEQEGKKLPGKLSSQSKTPFLSNFNSAPKPFGSPRLEPKSSTGSFNSAHSRPSSIPANEPIPSNGNETKGTAPSLLTTDFDYIPDNGNVDVPQYSLETQQQQQPHERFQRPQQQQQQSERPHQQPQRTQQQSEHLQQPQKTQQQPEQLQQREVAVEAEKVWFCYKCVLPIQANQTAIFAQRAGEDKCWHPECFVCTICNETLADLIYFYAEGNIYCGRHYAEQMNIPRCKACDELIFATEYTNAEGANWHTDHFCCWICDTPLVGKQYTPIDGQPHCLDCYQKKYGKDCHECGKAIRADEARVSHGELYWHASDTCFRCQQCRNSLLNRQFLLKGQSTFCSRDCATKAKVSDTK